MVVIYPELFLDTGKFVHEVKGTDVSYEKQFHQTTQRVKILKTADTTQGARNKATSEYGDIVFTLHTALAPALLHLL